MISMCLRTIVSLRDRLSLDVLLELKIVLRKLKKRIIQLADNDLEERTTLEFISKILAGAQEKAHNQTEARIC